MSRFNRSLALAAVSAVALVAVQGVAHAGGYGVREQSATAQGYSYAGAASGSGRLSSMYWNPATITMAPGSWAENHLSLVVPNLEITPLPGTPDYMSAWGGSGSFSFAGAPMAGYGSFQLSDRLWVGFGSTTPFAKMGNPRDSWAGQVYGRSSKIVGMNFNPVVGFKVNEWLSIGAGPTIQYFQMRSKRAAGLGPDAPSIILDGDDWGFGFTAGATLTPVAGTTIGIGYRSSIHHDLEGKLSLPAGIAGPGAPTMVLPFSASHNQPEMVTVGLSQKIGPAFTVHLGFEWMNWSRLKSPAIVSDGHIVGVMNFNMKDGYYYSAGLDYQVTDRLTLRAGVGYDKSPIDISIRNPGGPDVDKLAASIGGGYQWDEAMSFDVSYTRYFGMGNVNFNVVPGHQDYIEGLPFAGKIEGAVDVFSIGLRIRLDEPKGKPPAIVRTKS